jgi:hypothetical protein
VTLTCDTPLPDVRPVGLGSYVVAYSPVITCCVCSNTAMVVLYSAASAEAAVFYQVKYLAKDSTVPTHILSLLLDARIHVAQHPSRAEDTGTDQRTVMHTMTRVINCYNGLSEVSATTATLCLLGGANEVFSHGFWYISPWQCRKRAVESRLAAAFDDSGAGVRAADDADQDIVMVAAADGDGSDADSTDDLERYVAAQYTDAINAGAPDRPTGDAVEDDADLGEVVCEGGQPCNIRSYTDYECRGDALKDMCPFVYAGTVTTKAATKPAASSTKRDDVDVAAIDGGARDAAAAATSPQRAGAAKRRTAGRPANGTFPFDATHPLHKRRVQVLRSKFLVPILGGAAPPPHPGRRVRTVKWERAAQTFSEYYLTLFCPWQRLADDAYGPAVPLTWETFVQWYTFEGVFAPERESYAARALRDVACDVVFGLRVKRADKTRLNGFRMRRADTQLEAPAARAAALASAATGARDPVDAGASSDDDHRREFFTGERNNGLSEADAAATVLATQLLQADLTLLAVSRQPQTPTDVNLVEHQRIVDAGMARAAALAERTAAAAAGTLPRPRATSRARRFRYVVAGSKDDVGLMEASLKAAGAPEPRTARGSTSAAASARAADSQRKAHDARIVHKRPSDRLVRETFWNDIVAEEVDESPDARLNVQQNLAFVDIICSVNRVVRYDAHLREYTLEVQAGTASDLPPKPERPVPSPMFVTGGAGVGKSYFCGIVCERLSHDRVVVCASTGAAAAIVTRATTVHSLLNLKVFDRDGPTSASHAFSGVSRAAAKRVQERIPDSCVLLVLDELSMVSRGMLVQIDNTLREVRHSSQPFGGMMVLALGDMLQLPAVGGSLTSAVVEPTPAQDGKTAAGAAALFRLFRVLEFTEQMRVRDAEYAAVVNRFRTHMDDPVTAETVAAVKPLSIADVAFDSRWRNTPVIVTTNFARAVHNDRGMERHAREIGVPIIAWRLEMMVNPTSILQAAGHITTGDGAGTAPKKRRSTHTDVPLSKLGTLAERYYARNACPAATVLFVPGAPGVLTENLSPAVGLANGTAIVMHSITVEPADLANLHARLAAAAPGEIVLLQRPPLSINVHITSLAPTYGDDGRVVQPTPAWAAALDMRRSEPERASSPSDSGSSSPSSPDEDGPDLGPVFAVRPLCKYKVVKSAPNAGPDFRAKLKEYDAENPVSMVDAGFAFTYHKIQGGTYERLVLDLSDKQGSMLTAATLYMGMSRVRLGNRIRCLPLTANEHKDLRHLKNLRFPNHVQLWMKCLVPEGPRAPAHGRLAIKIFSQHRLDHFNALKDAEEARKSSAQSSAAARKAVATRDRLGKAALQPPTAGTPTKTAGRGRGRGATRGAALRGSPLRPVVHFAARPLVLDTPPRQSAPARPTSRTPVTSVTPRLPTPAQRRLLTPPSRDLAAATSPRVAQTQLAYDDAQRATESSAAVVVVPQTPATPRHDVPAAGGSSGGGGSRSVAALTLSGCGGGDHAAAVAVQRHAGALEPPGLENPSNYCYGNAMLQLLSRVPPLAAALQTAQLDDACAIPDDGSSAAAATPALRIRRDACFVASFRDVLLELRRRAAGDAGGHLHTTELYARMHRASTFAAMLRGRQEDTTDFAVSSIDVVQSVLELAPTATADARHSNMASLDTVQSALSGFEYSQLRCLCCGYSWTDASGLRPFTTLQLEITPPTDGEHSTTVDSCVRAFFEEQVLDEETECANSHCAAARAREAWADFYTARGQHRQLVATVAHPPAAPTQPPALPAGYRVVRRIVVTHTGEYVIASVKRFYHDAYGTTLKDTTPVALPDVVQLPITVVPGDLASTITSDFDVIATVVRTRAIGSP